MRNSLLLVAGFTVVFTALVASFAFVGSLSLANFPLLVAVAAIGIILMGRGMIGVIQYSDPISSGNIKVSGQTGKVSSPFVLIRA